MPVGNVAGDSVITGQTAGGAMIVAYTTLAKHPLASVPRIVVDDVPAVVGVPDTMPAVVSVNPDGSAPAVMVNVYGAVPPAPVMVRVYAVPTMPLARVAGDNVTVGHTMTGAITIV